MLIKSSPPVTQFTCFCNFLSLLHLSYGLFTVTQLLSRNVTLAPRKTQKSSVTHSFQGLCFLELNLGVATKASHPCFFFQNSEKNASVLPVSVTKQWSRNVTKVLAFTIASKALKTSSFRKSTLQLFALNISRFSYAVPPKYSLCESLRFS